VNNVQQAAMLVAHPEFLLEAATFDGLALPLFSQARLSDVRLKDVQ
jgi:hypothetical protein